MYGNRNWESTERGGGRAPDTMPKSHPGKNRQFYTEEEKHALVQLVLAKVHIIEQKKSDTMTLQDKHDTWDDITEKFNQFPCCTLQRDTRQLRKLWDNIKTRAKRLVADERAARLAVSHSNGVMGGIADMEDSIAEKVIYYMGKNVQQQQQLTMAPSPCDEDDVEYYVEMENASGDDQEPHLPAEPERGEVYHTQPPASLPSTSSNKAARFSSHPNFTNTEPVEILNLPRFPGRSSPPRTSSDVDGWIPSRKARTLHQQRVMKQRTLARLQREEHELRIRKLRLDMKHARSEHEERMKVLKIQQEVLKSLKPNQTSIISCLLK